MDVLKVIRQRIRGEAMLGVLEFNGTVIAHTLEDLPRAQKIKGRTAIPAGNYQLGFHNGGRLNNAYSWDGSKLTEYTGTNAHALIHVRGVPGFQFILIHWGNGAEHTEGCLLVGSRRGVLNGKPAVLASRKKYEEIYPILRQAMERGTLTQIQYINAYYRNENAAV